MKHNLVPQDVEEMSFKRLTIVLNQPGAEKSFSPVNPEAVLLAVKGAEDQNPVVRALDALRSALLCEKFFDPTKASKGAADGADGEDAGNPAATAIASAAAAPAKDAPPASDAPPAKDSPPKPGQAAVAAAQNDGVHAALFNGVADLHGKLNDIHHHPTLTDPEKRKAMAEAIADHAVSSTALAAALHSGKAQKAIEDAEKAGARHSKADLADLQKAHDHLSSTQAAVAAALETLKTAHDSAGNAKEHAAKLLGDPNAVSHNCDGADGADSADGAEKGAETGAEDNMTQEQIDALAKGLASAVATGFAEAVKAIPQPAPAAEVKPLDTEALVASLAAAVNEKIDAVKADVAAFDAKIETAIAAATKAAAEAAKSDVEKLEAEVEAAEAAKAAAIEAADAVKAKLAGLVHESRERKAAGGHESDASKGKNNPKTSQQVADELKAANPNAKTADVISAIFRADTVTR